MKKRYLMATGLLLLAACGQNNEDAKKFYPKAAAGNAAEVKIGGLAAQQAVNADVRAYGETLRSDHMASGQAVQQAAASEHVTAPATPPSEAEAEYNKLSKLTGADFDTEFLNYMIDAHKKTIDVFQDAAKSKDAQVAKLAQDTLPTLQKHLDAAQTLKNLPPAPAADMPATTDAPAGAMTPGGAMAPAPTTPPRN